MYATEKDGIQFYEGRPENCSVIQSLVVELGGVVRQAQLKTLKDVKILMAAKTKKAGGNAVVDFEYGQRSVGWFRSIFQLDDVNWYGRGKIAHVSDPP